MKTKMLIASAAFVLTLCLGLTSMSRAADDTKSLKGKAAPDFTLATLDGKEFKLSDNKDSVTIVDFWATWCPPCRKALPHLQAIATDEKLAKRGLKVVAVDVGEKSDVIKKFLETNKYTFNVALDAKNEVSGKQYMVQGIPTTLIIGRDLTIKEVFVGFGGEASEKALDKAVEEALGAEKK